MIIRDFKKMVAAIDESDDDCFVVVPIFTQFRGVMAFEAVCPSVSNVVEFGPSPEWIKGCDANDGKPMRALLIAPHSFHANDDDSAAHPEEAEKN